LCSQNYQIIWLSNIKFSAHERFWNNIHQVAQDQKIGKPNNLIVLGTQYLWVLMLCRSFFTPGRDIGWVRKGEGVSMVKGEGKGKKGGRGKHG
jgi:hypothetical protein